MEQAITVHRVAVFTRTTFAGNPAGVVLDAERLSDRAMQMLAREVNLSETAFLCRQRRGGVVFVRFFTPRQEVPVCGRATLAAHCVRARHLRMDAGEVTQVSPGASWRVRWQTAASDTMVVMVQGPVMHGAVWDGAVLERLLVALGLRRHALRAETPVQVLSTGHAKVVVPLREARVLKALRPNLAVLAALSDQTGVSGYFLFAPGTDGALTTCRMFAPAIGVPEDPGNGSGHGPLGAYLARYGGPEAEAAKRGFWSSMGDALGRPGQVWVRVLDGEREVEVGGYTTPIGTTTLKVEGVERIG